MENNYFEKISSNNENNKDLKNADRIFSYKPGTIEANGQPEGGRDLSTYENILLFNRDELDGKVVLDLGAGPESKFAKELEESGVNTKVISLSPDFSEGKYSKKVRELLPDGKLVAAVGQAMPFKNETFDRILALHVLHVGEHISYEVFFEIIHEIVRVLKKGGQAKLGPMLNMPGIINWLPYEAILQNEALKDYLDNQGIEIVKEFIPTTVIPVRKIRDMGGDFYREQSFNIILNKKEN